MAYMDCPAGLRLLLRYVAIFLIGLPFTTATVSAASDTPEAGPAETTAPAEPSPPLEINDESAIQNLLDLMESETDAAESTRMNVDFIPGMITALWGDDLMSKGARTVYDAFALIPGFYLSMSPYGQKTISYRGLVSTSGRAPLKLLLNNVSFNYSLDGGDSFLYDIPLEQVERMEIIRGSDDILFGESSRGITVNIITKTRATEMFGRYTSYGTFGAGLTDHYNAEDKRYTMSINVAQWETDGGDAICTSDSLTGTPVEDAGWAPGPTNEARKNTTAVFTTDYNDLSFIGQYIYVGMGDYYGYGATLPPPEDKIVQEYRVFAAEARYEKELFWDLETRIRTGWMQLEHRADVELLPAGAIPLFEDGLRERTDYMERHVYSRVDTTWEGWTDHAWLLGCQFKSIIVVDSSVVIEDSHEDFLRDIDGRKYVNLFINDQYRAFDWLTLSAGLQYDYYDDVDDTLTPRLEAVTRFRDRHVFKIKFAREHRPPTFRELTRTSDYELGSNKNLNSENFDTYETEYIYKGVSTDWRFRLFYSDMTDLISRDALSEQGEYQYNNTGSGTTKGAELEVNRHILNSLNLNGNITYVTTKEDGEGNEFSGVANWLANAGVTYELTETIVLNTQFRYVGERHRAPADTRDKTDDSHTVDVTATCYHLFLNGLTVRAGIRNMLDEEVVYPGSMGYEDDLERPGREYWVQLQYAF